MDLPDDNPKTAYGVRKPGMSAVPPAALIPLMQAMAEGRRKYGAMNWREQNVSATIYYDAAMRHLMAWFDGEEVDPAEHGGSGASHLGHVMACCAILLDAQSVGALNDDRPHPGKFADDVRCHTQPPPLGDGPCPQAPLTPPVFAPADFSKERAESWRDQSWADANK